jgi:hypothetical protein
MTARDAAADDLLDMVDFTSPPAFATPPELPRAAAPTASRRGPIGPMVPGPPPDSG